MLKSVVHRSRLPPEATSAQELCIMSFMNWVYMAEQLHTRPPCAMPSGSRTGAKQVTTELWDSGNALWSDESRSLMDESGFGGCQENATHRNAQRQQ